MKNKLFIWCLSFMVLFAAVNMTSCSRKTGCPVNDPSLTGAKTNKDGSYKSKRGKTNLFPKTMRKKKKKS